MHKRHDRKITTASIDHLYRIFTASDRLLTDLETDFSDSCIPEQPTFVSDHVEFLLEKLVKEAVHTASPGFIGHMTSAFPYFMLANPLTTIETLQSVLAEQAALVSVHTLDRSESQLIANMP